MLAACLRILTVCALLYWRVDGSGSAPSSEIASSASSWNFLAALPIPILQEQICSALDRKSLLRLTAVSLEIRSITFSCYVQSVLDLFRTSFRPIPNLKSHVRMLSELSGEPLALAESCFQNLSPAEICRLVDQILNRLIGTDRDCFLQTYPVLQSHFDSMEKCHYVETRFPAESFLKGETKRLLLKRLGDLGVEMPTNRNGQLMISNHAMVKAFRDGGRLHLLTDEVFLWELLSYGIRLNLITILYYVPIPDNIEALLPIYWTFWSYLSYLHGFMDWGFLESLRDLQEPNSQTDIRDFWRIPSVQGYYQRLIDDTLHIDHGDFTPERFRLLAELQFPFLADFVSPEGVHRIFRFAVSSRFLALLNFLLVESNYSIHRFLTGPFRLDLHEKFVNRQSAIDCITWLDIVRFSDIYPQLINLLVESAPPSLWRTVAFKLRGSVELKSVFTIRSLQLHDVIPNLDRIRLKRNRTPFPSCPDLIERLAQRLRAKSHEIGSYQMDLDCIVPKSYQYDRPFLEEIVNEHDSSTGFPLLHVALWTASYRALVDLMALPSIDLTVQDKYGHIAFDYISGWKRRCMLEERCLQCADLLSRHLDRLRNAFAGQTVTKRSKWAKLWARFFT